MNGVPPTGDYSFAKYNKVYKFATISLLLSENFFALVSFFNLISMVESVVLD